MPLNVAFYSDALTSSGYGLGRYARGLFHALGQLSPEIQIRPVSAHLTRTGPENSNRTLRENGYVRLPYPRKVIAGLWSSIGFPRLERWTPWADVVHCVELDYRIATRKPLVVTIHDIGPLTHPEFFRNSHPWLLETALKSALERADAIICVSRATAEAVEDYAKCALGDRLTVIAEGVSEEFFQPTNASRHDSIAPFVDRSRSEHDPSLPESPPYFLWAGSLNPRKNLLRIVEAFERAAPKIPHHLVLTGSLGWDSDATLRRVHNSVVGSRIHLRGHVSDLKLRELYRSATAFVYASLMEGFGLPILEAMASGCPVITSNVSSMPEVAGDAAFLVNPLDTNEIAEAMTCVATDPTFSQQLSIKGRARAEDFRWESCAVSVAEIYTRVAKVPQRKKQAHETGLYNQPQSEPPPVTTEREKKGLCVQSSPAQPAA